MSLLKSAVSWFLRTYPGRLIQAYASGQAGNYAGSLAFNAFISMFPLILGLAAIVGLVLHSQQAQTQFVRGAVGFFPSDSQGALSSALHGVSDKPVILLVIAIVGFLWSGTSLFITMEWVLGRMLGSRQRDFLKQRAMALIMSLIFVIAIAASIALNSLIALAQGFPLVAPMVSLLVWLGFMAAVYRLVPNRTYRVRQMWPGIVLAGCLMEVLTLVWPLYTGLSHGFSTYGAAFALFFILATWLYFFSQFILLGAVANRMHAGEPSRPGLMGSHQTEKLETEATRAADQYGRYRSRAG